MAVCVNKGHKNASFVDSVIYHDFRDLIIFHPLFGLESQIMRFSKKLLNIIFYVIALLYDFFML